MKSDETMNYLNLIRGTVLKMNQATFAQWKDALAGQYIVFSVIAPEEIDQEIMAEKLCDYFEKAELKNGKSFEKFVEVYFSNLDSIVAGRVVKAPQQRKKMKPLCLCPVQENIMRRRRKSERVNLISSG